MGREPTITGFQYNVTADMRHPAFPGGVKTKWGISLEGKSVYIYKWSFGDVLHSLLIGPPYYRMVVNTHGLDYFLQPCPLLHAESAHESSIWSGLIVSKDRKNASLVKQGLGNNNHTEGDFTGSSIKTAKEIYFLGLFLSQMELRMLLNFLMALVAHVPSHFWFLFYVQRMWKECHSVFACLDILNSNIVNQRLVRRRPYLYQFPHEHL